MIQTWLTQPVHAGLIFVLVLLVIASLAVRVMQARKPAADYSELAARIRTWWVIILLLGTALLLPPLAGIVLFAFISYLAFKEYITLIPTRRADHRVLFLAYLAIPLQYYWVAIGWYGVFIVFIPVYVFLLLPLRMVLIGEMEGFIRAAGTLHWGLMVTVFSLSHAAYLLALPASGNPVAGGQGLLLYLLVLTELNDVAQYIWGKTFGRHKVLPKVSPKKTVEGLLGGILTTIIAAVILAPFLTPLRPWEAACMGLILGLGGFFGDVTISAVKRDLRIKDSGTILPGHGGILDRVDSLTFTAPLFFHLLYFMHY
jgi:phosphatidate cytidylyltransferase